MSHFFSLPLRAKGMSLLEIMVFTLVMAVAMTGALSTFLSSRLAQSIGEDRRAASLAAEQKIDEIRAYAQSGKTLDQTFQKYGPLPLPTGAPRATFNVPGLSGFYDLD